MNRIITIGADPEMFLETIHTHEVVSVEGLIGGTKETPREIDNEGHSLQEDNILVEYTIPPCITSEELVYHINYMKDYISNEILSNGLKLSNKASAYPNPKYLETEQAKRFGCDPDYNVYLRDVNPAPNPNATIRTAGGHIHIGYLNKGEQANITDVENIVKVMDLFLGVQSILLDSDKERRILYGKAGSFRFKDYGVEYRSISNFWTLSDDKIKWAFDNSVLSVYIALYNKEILEQILKESSKIEICINNSDENLAKELIHNLIEDIYILKENNQIKIN